ncbi:MAG: HAD-IA family hydrolase [Actinomycetota bacterium]|nr:HAD-IA family hydrolase [Actinomycetota bacterium]
MIKIIFFDAGGTILEPYPTFAEAFTRICRSHGYEVSPRDVRGVLHDLGPDVGEVAEETGVFNATTSPEKSRVFWGHLYERFLEALGISDPALRDDLLATFSDKSSYKLFPDVLDAFSELRQMGYRLGLISNFERWLEEVLVEEKAGDIFDVRVISGIEGVEKPDVEIYRLALSRAHAGASECVHVGDSMTNDIEPARAVGMKVVLIDRSDRFPEAAVPRIASLEELPRLIPAL